MIVRILWWLFLIGVVLTIINHPASADATVHRVVNRVEKASSGVSTFVFGL